MTDYTLIEGDPMNPCGTDLIVQQTRLNVGQPLPDGGWRVLTGNQYDSLIARVVYRYELEEEGY